MTRPLHTGLVLGGAGIVGLAYHAAALTALEHDLGWDARDADIVVGTSAGSIVACLLRMGVPLQRPGRPSRSRRRTDHAAEGNPSRGRR
jgi:predicted acylesterase/phospholipase RssA